MATDPFKKVLPSPPSEKVFGVIEKTPAKKTTDPFRDVVPRPPSEKVFGKIERQPERRGGGGGRADTLPMTTKETPTPTAKPIKKEKAPEKLEQSVVGIPTTTGVIRIETKTQRARREARTSLERFKTEPRLTSISPRTIVDPEGERVLITREQAPFVEQQLFGGTRQLSLTPKREPIIPGSTQKPPPSTVESVKIDKLQLVSRVKGFGGRVTGIIEEDVGNIFKGLEMRGITPESIGEFQSKISPFQFVDIPGISGKGLAEVHGGIVAGGIKEVRDKPIKTLGLVAVGGAIGGGVKIAGAGLGAVGGSRALKVGELAVKGGAIGLGTLAVIGTGIEVVTQPTPELKGEVLGRRGVQFGALGLGLSGGIKGFEKGLDVTRTIGLKELRTENVVAPEFFKGQTFPEIRRGQTAGQLRKEFFEPILPGELRGVPRGFTATSQTFAPVTETGIGDSFVPGLFQAPRVSPRFLRTGGERGFVGFGDILTTGKPSAIRLQPKTLELAPGVRPSQKGLAKADREFFESIKGTGRSVIPFAKTEKESVVAFGTPIEQTGKQFFFRFEGRRVTIQEFKTVPKEPLSTKPTKTITLGEVTSRVSSERIRTDPFISPLEFGASSLTKSTKTSRSIFRGLPSRPSSIIEDVSSSIGVSEISRGRGVSISEISSGISPIETPSRTSFDVSRSRFRSISSKSPSSTVSSVIEESSFRRRFIIPSIPIIGVPRFRGGIRIKRGFKRTPSFAAVELDFTSPKELKLEFTGLVERPVIKKRRRK